MKNIARGAMSDALKQVQDITRRRFFSQSGSVVGVAALASLFADDTPAAATGSTTHPMGLPHFAPRAKRVIYLCQSGAPSQIDLFDYKP